jgi:two-component system, LytTR family, sensor kinase
MTISLLNKRLIIYAAITSPLLAIYGVAPLYVFDKLNLAETSLVVFGLTLNVLLFWAINIFINKKYHTKNKKIIYPLSFGLVFLTFIPKAFVKSPLPFVNVIDQYLVYPAIITIAINTIIWIIINSVVTKIKNKQVQEEVEELRIVNLEAQKQVLIQQLQPHFLFNALSVLKSLIKEDADKAEHYSIKLSEFLRYSVQAHNNDLVSLEKELLFTNNYIELQKVRFQDSFTCIINTDIDKLVLQKKVPVYALQTLIENTIKHNGFTNKKPLNVLVKISNTKIEVTNNKIPKPLVEATGTGLQNLEKRYQLFANSNIQVDSNTNEFKVTINLID